MIKLKSNSNKNKQDVIIDVYADFESPKYDPDGSYTGTPKDEREVPVQDADDL